MTKSSLPGILGEIADIAGKEVAFAVAAARGGTRADIPARARPDHWLTEIVGLEVADRICSALAIQDADARVRGVRHELIPLGPAGVRKGARRQVVKALEGGVSARAAARKVGVHERTVWRVKADIIKADFIKDDRQGDLFDKSET
ncbi:MAG: hypothetical protein WA975_21655 [Mesorhizobium sp.]